MATNAQLIGRWFDEVWNLQRESTIDELFAADGIAHGLADGARPLPGPAVFQVFWNKFRSAFPDMHITLEDVMSDGDRTAARFSFAGTHGGDGLGIPPTGRRVRATGISITRWRDGKIVEGWNEFDVNGLLQQIGAAPAASARA
jgi:steroid delta-isomerase-like uncharacterized protein